MHIMFPASSRPQTTWYGPETVSIAAFWKVGSRPLSIYEYQSIFLSMCESIYRSIYLYIYPSVCLPVNEK